MNAARFKKVKDIFAEATEFPAERRSSRLRDLCGDDDDLFDEVSSLLAALDDPDHLIERNGLQIQHDLIAAGAGKLSESYIGRRFGSYEVIREVGRGGMGTVFLARRADGEFSQEVALKIVHRMILDEEAARRFRREREILASLNHPHIARLYDGGVSDSGEAFLAMEYVNGSTLLRHAKEKSLTTDERLRLFLKICDAVSYAHRNLTIHRDLKPGNVLVVGESEPKLIDFGLAKILDDGVSALDATSTMFRAFTPAYASPEQILGRNVTTTSDIYSLGVIFYELLAGETPFDFEGKSLEEIIATVSSADPAPPSVVKARLRGAPERAEGGQKLHADLDSIALKALQKEPEMRYGTVESLAEDVGRHLKGLPVLARPSNLSYRIAKFVKRNRISVSAAAAVFLTIVTGLILILWQANETRKERDRAEKRFGDVRKLSNSLLFELAPKIESLNGSTEARQLLVERALLYLDSLAAESIDDLALRSELASAYEKIGDLQGNPNKPNLADFAGAVSSYRKANQIRTELPFSGENRLLLANNFLQLSSVRQVNNDTAGAIADAEAALKLYQEAAAGSDSPELRRWVLVARTKEAQIYSDNNQYSVAIPLFEKILADLNDIEIREKDDRALRIRAETIYAKSLSWDGRQDEAEEIIDRAVTAADALLAAFPNDAFLRQEAWRSFSTAASVYENVKNDRALAMNQKAILIAEAAVSSDNADLQSKQNLARSYSRSGFVLVLLGKTEEALTSLRKSEKLSRELVDNAPRNAVYQKDFGRLYVRFGDFYRKQKDLPAALESYQNSAERFRMVHENDRNDTVAKRDMAQSLKNVAETFVLMNRKGDAVGTFRNALDILLELEAANAIGNYDKKMITDVRSALEKLTSG